jgi:hypothetical protein
MLGPYAARTFSDGGFTSWGSVRGLPVTIAPAVRESLNLEVETC